MIQIIPSPPALRRRPPDSHKGTYGHVFVLAGSAGMTGAAFLTTQSALRSGAGLVTLGVPRSLQPILASKLTCAITVALPESPRRTFSSHEKEETARMIANRYTCLAMGPGVSQDIDTKRLVLYLLQTVKLPTVLDADGINVLPQHPTLLHEIGHDVILTPHPGEMARLTGLTTEEIQKDRQGIALDFAKTFRTILVLKGHRTLVTDGEKLFINPTGNPGMATAGAGDVLTGMIAGLLVQGYSPFDSAVLGVYLHGLAGDIARESKGEYALIATDILDCLPRSFIRHGDTTK
ncbi:MAG: NAD(P)H-hydrate dehydratase [Planctomycetota bacterium]